MEIKDLRDVRKFVHRTHAESGRLLAKLDQEIVKAVLIKAAAKRKK